MKYYFTIAWRNIWRNKRRTFITGASIFFALFFSLLMRSMQEGSYSQMKINGVESFTGAIQIHAKGYWDDKIVDRTFQLETQLLTQLRANPAIKQVSQRIESGLLASAGTKSKVAMVLGVDLEIEDHNLSLRPKLTSGTFPAKGTDGVLLAEGLAKYLKLAVGDSLVLKGIGYHGQTAEALLPVVGILKFPLPELNNQITFLNFETAQVLFGLEGKATSLAINLHNLDDAERVKKTLTETFDLDRFEVMTWQELTPALYQQIESDRKSGLFVIYLLYLIVGFGIVGTVIMMVAERRKEFGVMIAVGLRKIKLAFILIIELVYLGVLAIVAGLAVSIPFLYYFYLHPIPVSGEMAKSFEMYGMEPIFPFGFAFNFFFEQSLMVFYMVLFCALLPIYSIARLKVVDTLHN